MKPVEQAVLETIFWSGRPWIRNHLVWIDIGSLLPSFCTADKFREQ